MDKFKIEDTIFSQAFVEHLGGLKEMFNIQGEVFKPVRGDIKEIKLDRLSVDFVYEVDNEKLIHFEFQSTNKSSDIFRFELYDSHLISAYKKPIETYVIYTNSIRKVNHKLEYESIKYYFTPIYMAEFSADKVLKDIKSKFIKGVKLELKDIALLEFTPLMESKISKQEVIEIALNLSTDIDDIERKIQCQTILVALSLKFNVEINNELGRKIRMSPLGQKIFNEGLEEGKLEGIIEVIIDNLKDIDIISEDLINKIKSQSDINILKKWNKISARSNSVKEFVENM